MMDFADNSVLNYYRKLKITFQKLIDQSVPYVFPRWIGFATLLSLFLVRILIVQGWYIICYTLAINLLSLFLSFLTPKFDPSLEQELKALSLEEGANEHEQQDDEFRPFIRKLPEFNFWLLGTAATSVSLILSFFPIFDIPVFWPILVMYFIILFALTMRRQIQHMMKYKYLPFDLGKAKYGR